MLSSSIFKTQKFRDSVSKNKKSSIYQPWETEKGFSEEIYLHLHGAVS